MTDALFSAIPGDVQLTDFDVALEPGGGRFAMSPVVHGLSLRISAKGVQMLAQALVDEADRRAPVGLRLKDARVADGGIDLYLRVEKGIFGSDLSTRLVLSAPGGQVLRVEIVDTGMPSWLPLDMMLDEAVKRSNGAVQRDPQNRRALLLDPVTLMTRAGVPGRFAPGRWDVATSPAGVALTFREGSAGAA